MSIIRAAMLGTKLKSLERGFSLLEISIALTILSVLSYHFAVNVKTGRDYDHAVENRGTIEKVRAGLLTFAQSNGYLPCPDNNADGWEDRSGDQCASVAGRLPYLMLGVEQTDAWGAPWYYAVNSQTNSSDISNASSSASYFASVGAPVYRLNTPPEGVTQGTGNQTICGETETSACNGSTASADEIELNAIATVVSFGKNGEETWALMAAGNENTLPESERENADGDGYFWKAVPTAAMPFDDQLVWISAFDLKYALLRSERTLQ